MSSQVEAKVCKTCGAEKPLEDFYPVKSKVGRAAVCRDCSLKRDAAWRANNRERYNERQAAWAGAHKDKKRQKDRSRRERDIEKARADDREKQWRRRNEGTGREYEASRADSPEVVARETLRTAVRRGRVTKPENCGECGEQTPARLLHGHHDDYSKPLEVDWLCSRCHGKRHRR